MTRVRNLELEKRMQTVEQRNNNNNHASDFGRPKNEFVKLKMKCFLIIVSG